MKFDTKVVHSTLHNRSIKSKSTPIYQTSAFTFSSLEELEGFYEGKSPYLYSRSGNPNTDELGEMVAALEGAPAGVAAASGLGAILAGILAVTESGDHIIAAEDIYGGTYQLLNEELKTFGITTSFVDFSIPEEIEKSITPQTKLLYSESITNPFLRVENMDAMVSIAKKHKLVTMIDNTFATPYLMTPYSNGVDIVAHSATKYIGGHSDVTAGVTVGSEEVIAKARTKVINLGFNLSPHEAWLTARGCKTLSLRMKQQCVNASELAEALLGYDGIKKVYYPKDAAEKGSGAIVTIELSEQNDIHRFFTGLSWVKIVPTLAGVETTVSYPQGTSHRALSQEAREKIGVNQQVVRISVGIEDSGDIIQAFKDAVDYSRL
ncbi:aminotransferase class I/II-fold pyridoxal phosphate-dependent enzyme [Rossellomorea vietnamensis]|uniref:homocysteine desulfhydrase n=1 Tax=Rossellomorea vietnamensis TaxID=218284 RepID=A0A5D4NP07_9BACI|nr:aminotransferase class I/II-fold pyridoxal phosphate-dependent enzyme [Rossellomorea vietnamensis]TYS15218.1 aminotransferase class I/II-fold pyridoxal phosphate-dependent enzyme [Rossellomorea vietnamensis]